MKKILTIGIPTYNRASYIQLQLNYLKKQIERNPYLINQIDFIVSDNCSSDNSIETINRIKKTNDFFTLLEGETNLGIIGNVQKVLRYASTDFIWFVSDDDKIKEGVLEKVLEILTNFGNSVEYIFLNFSIKNKLAYTGERTGICNDSKEMAISIFNESYGALLLLTSSIYKRTNILDISKESDFAQKLSAPLLFSFYSCAQGSIYIEKKSLLEFNMGNASYAGLKRVTKLKFEDYIQIIKMLPDFGYDKPQSKKAIKNFISDQSHSHLIYNFLNPFKSIKLYKYYTFKTLIRLPINIIRYIFR